MPTCNGLPRQTESAPFRLLPNVFPAVPAAPLSAQPPGQHSTRLLIMAYCLVWALVHWFAYPNLDPYNDMLENFAWGQTFEWGTFKHPPFFVWAVELWFAVMPRSALSYKLLSYLNVAIGLWGVAHLARLLGLRKLAPSAVLLLMWTLPYTTLAAKFNANAILLSVWPWTAVAWLASLRQSGRPGLTASVWLGFLGAVCMLSKYYSGVFLFSLFVTALLRRDMRRWFGSLRPYVALLSLLRQIPRLALRSWLPLHWQDTVFWLAALPGAVTLLAGMAGMAELSSPWAIPIIYAFPLLWLRNLEQATTPTSAAASDTDTPTTRSLKALQGSAWPVLAGVVLVGVVLAVTQDSQGKRSYYEANEIAAERMMQGWQQRHPDLPLGWTGGEWAENAMVAFFVSDQVRALPGMPDEWPTTLAPHPGWEHQGGLMICPRGPLKKPQVYEASNCEVEVQQWLEKTGRPIRPLWVTAARSGWRFPHPMEFAWVVYDVLPTP